MNAAYRYDSQVDILYVQLNVEAIASQEETHDGVILDVTEAGELVGVEVINPNGEWDWASIAQDYRLAPAQAGLLRVLAATKWKP